MFLDDIFILFEKTSIYEISRNDIENSAISTCINSQFPTFIEVNNIKIQREYVFGSSKVKKWIKKRMHV